MTNYTHEQLNDIMIKNGGSLDLSGTQITSLPDNLTVGGYLDLRGTQITSLPDNLTVGGYLNLFGTQIKQHKAHTLKNGDYVPNRYIYADNILTHIKRVKKIGNYTYYVGKIKGNNVIFDGTYYSHCKNVKDGIVDLIFKAAKDRGAEQYKYLNINSTVTADEAITMYRIITGACKAGTERFINSLGELKENYTIRDIIALTKGQYGAETFVKYFNKSAGR